MKKGSRTERKKVIRHRKEKTDTQITMCGNVFEPDIIPARQVLLGPQLSAVIISCKMQRKRKRISLTVQQQRKLGHNARCESKMQEKMVLINMGATTTKMCQRLLPLFRGVKKGFLLFLCQQQRFLIFFFFIGVLMSPPPVDRARAAVGKRDAWN